jgi:DNA primase
MIPEEIIARVRESVDLVELVRETVPGLKKRGRNYQARCPFHQERTPSFHVNPEMGVFKCFGCGAGGDAFKFLMLTEGLSYPEAIRKIAARVGIAIPETVQQEALSEETKKREKLYALLEEAAGFYHRQLLESSEALEVRDYLKKRGLTAETITGFQIGFAPASGHALRDAAVRKGWTAEILESAGLLRRKEETGRIFDHFWNRVIFPIRDTQGRVVAFGGRARGDALPKYINSPETPVYSKSRHLYGLFQGLSSVRKKRNVVILEGYMDVAVCHQYGFDWTAATLGTALTEDHLRLLRKYADSVTLLFDPDTAGAAATLRGGEMLLESGMPVNVVTLPDGRDADEILIEKGAKGLEQFLNNSVSFIDYSISQSMAHYSPVSPEGKLSIAKEVLPLIRKIRDPLLQEEHLGRLADKINVEKGVLGRQMTLDAQKNRRNGVGKEKIVAEQPQFLLSLEEEILLLALLYPSAPVYDRLKAFDWQNEQCRQVWDVAAPAVEKMHVNLSELLPQMDVAVSEWVTSLMPRMYEHARPEDALEHFLDAWQRQRDTAHLQSLRGDIDSMIEGRIPMDGTKVRIYNELSRKLKGSTVEV